MSGTVKFQLFVLIGYCLLGAWTFAQQGPVYALPFVAVALALGSYWRYPNSVAGRCAGLAGGLVFTIAMGYPSFALTFGRRIGDITVLVFTALPALVFGLPLVVHILRTHPDRD
jgi:hypothetical protein